MDSSEKEKQTRQYDVLADKFREIYLAGKERSREAMDVALSKAREELTRLGEFGVEQGDQLTRYLERDMDQTMQDMHKLGEEAKERFNPSRLGAGALASLAAALEYTSEALHSMSSKTKEALTYHTGEITSAGTLTCRACGQEIHLKNTGHVPPCPKCAGTVFDKGY